MVEVKATLSRNLCSSTRCPPAVKGTETLGSLLEENLCVCVCAGCAWILFIHSCCQIGTPIQAGRCSRCFSPEWEAPAAARCEVQT